VDILTPARPPGPRGCAPAEPGGPTGADAVPGCAPSEAASPRRLRYLPSPSLLPAPLTRAVARRLPVRGFPRRRRKRQGGLPRALGALVLVDDAGDRHDAVVLAEVHQPHAARRAADRAHARDVEADRLA